MRLEKRWDGNNDVIPFQIYIRNLLQIFDKRYREIAIGWVSSVYR